jgi:hypothetical protein
VLRDEHIIASSGWYTTTVSTINQSAQYLPPHRTIPSKPPGQHSDTRPPPLAQYTLLTLAQSSLLNVESRAFINCITCAVSFSSNHDPIVDVTDRRDRPHGGHNRIFGFIISFAERYESAQHRVGFFRSIPCFLPWRVLVENDRCTCSEIDIRTLG